MKRAYSLLTVKAIDEDKRIITGVATTPTPDRIGDIVEPEGAEFQLPIPLLWQHNSREPIGFVTEARVTPEGITVTAQIESSDEPGPLKNLLDFAWQSIKKKLVRGLSIGFKEIEYARIENTYSYRYLKWLWLELSAVTIPANGEATIETIKSIDAPLLAASGREQRARNLPGATGSRKSVSVRPKEAKTMKKTIAEQISAFEDARKEKNARMDELLDAAGEAGETLDAEQQEEYDGLAEEVKAIDDHIKRLKDREARNIAQARAVDASLVRTAERASEQRAGVQVKASPKLDRGIALARIARCMAIAHLRHVDVIRVAEQLYGENDLTVGVLKAAVVGGTAISGNWAANLVSGETDVYADFAEFLRPMTIIGQFGQGNVPNLLPIPFDTPLLGQTAGGSGFWVGEGKAVPLTKADFSRTTLPPLKVGNICVLTKELLFRSGPNVDALIRAELAKAIAERADLDFITPTNAGSAGVKPAAVTYGAHAVASNGIDADSIRGDARSLMQAFIDASNLKSLVWVMSASNALGAANLFNALGQNEFPGLTINGGSFMNLPTIVSEYIGDTVALVAAGDIYIADENGVEIDISTEASLEMSDAPANDVKTPTAAQLVSMFQTNSVALRALRMINWARRRSTAVAYLTGAAWGGPVALS